MPLEDAQEEAFVNHIQCRLVLEVVKALPELPESPHYRFLPHLHLPVALLVVLTGGRLGGALGGRYHVQLLQRQELGLRLAQEYARDQAHLLDYLQDPQRVEFLANQLVRPDELCVTPVPAAR